MTDSISAAVKQASDNTLKAAENNQIGPAQGWAQVAKTLAEAAAALRGNVAR
jgi:hypothetical protein